MKLKQKNLSKKFMSLQERVLILTLQNNWPQFFMKSLDFLTTKNKQQVQNICKKLKMSMRLLSLFWDIEKLLNFWALMFLESFRILIQNTLFIHISNKHSQQLEDFLQLNQIFKIFLLGQMKAKKLEACLLHLVMTMFWLMRTTRKLN